MEVLQYHAKILKKKRLNVELVYYKSFSIDYFSQIVLNSSRNSVRIVTYVLLESQFLSGGHGGIHTEEREPNAFSAIPLRVRSELSALKSTSG